MNVYLFANLSDDALEQKSDLTHAAGRTNDAVSIGVIAEIDARRLYLRSAYPSMFAYCLGRLMLSDDSASKRIQAARTALRFPEIFEMIADGRMHLSGTCLLAPHLTEGNARELLAAAAHQSKSGIARVIVERFPRTESFDLVLPVPAPRQNIGQHAPVSAPGQNSAQPAPPPTPSTAQHDSMHVASSDLERGATPLVSERVDVESATGEVRTAATRAELEAAHVESAATQTPFAPAQVETAGTRTKVAPMAGQRFTLQVTVTQSTYDKLRHAQALLGHQVPAGELAKVLDLALDALINKLEKRKLGATDRPHSKVRPSKAARTIPARVRREVWDRDGGQCTFVSEAGRRCCERKRLEFDHIDEVARGGKATTDRIRLRCRDHNQYTAELAFGKEFMARKRAEARERADEARAARAREAVEEARLARAAAAEARAREGDTARQAVSVTRAAGEVAGFQPGGHA